MRGLFTRPCVILTLAALGAGCGGGGAPGLEPGPSPEGPALTVAESLTALGVDISATDTPRVDAYGVAYPADYAPLGARVEMTEMPDGRVIYGRPPKWMLVGVAPSGQSGQRTVLDNLPRPGSPGTRITPTILQVDDPSWALDTQASPLADGTKRDATACDVDGDGDDELVFVYVVGSEVRLEVAQGDDGGAGDLYLALPFEFPASSVSDLRVVGGDFDGDGRCELAIGVSRMADRKTEVHVFDDAVTGFARLRSLGLSVMRAAGSVQLVLAAGSVDYDASSELAVAVNEREVSSEGVEAQTRLSVFDDAATGFAVLHDGPVEAVLPSGIVRAVVADVSIADLDRDGAGEVLLAGVDRIVFPTGYSNPELSPRHVLVALDDALRGFAAKAACAPLLGPTGVNAAVNLNRRTAFVHVNAVDIDGDEDLEIQVGGFVLDRVPDSDVNWAQLPSRKDAVPGANWAYRLKDFPFPSNIAVATFDRGCSDVQIADVDGDGRQDVVTYSGITLAQTQTEIQVHGLDSTGEALDVWGTLPAAGSGSGTTNPILVPVAAALTGTLHETAVLEFVSHTSGFTAPIVLAALAAPPTVARIAQNHGASVTRWGRSLSQGSETEGGVELSAGIGVGFEFTIPWVQIKSKGKFMFMNTATFLDGGAYSLTQKLGFTTGPGEDAVVFSSIPMDNYTYRVIHHPQRARIGTTVTISLPRVPVVRIAERSYYNAHAPAGAPRVDESVFRHVVGDVATYPSRGVMAQTLAEMRSQVEDSREALDVGQPCGALCFRAYPQPGLVTELAGVGIGSGATDVALELTQEQTRSSAFSQDFELELEQTVLGVLTVLNFSAGQTWSTKVSHGTGSEASGTVGSISPQDFDANRYSFGLFSYLQADPVTHLEFQVVNYWVER